MISIEEALNRIKNHLPKRQTHRQPLAAAAGAVLAEDIPAGEPSPTFTNSAMDGYAVRWDDVRPAGSGQPVSLKVSGEIRAGVPLDHPLRPGEAVAISTGGQLCEGADTVIPVEDVEIGKKMISVRTVKKQFANVRFAGEEFSAGTVLLKAGVRLGAPHLAVLAGQGVTEVPVFRCPAVSVVVTGTELVDPAEKPQAGQIRDSNGLMLSTAIRASGGTVFHNNRVGDRYSATVAAIRHSAARSDLIILSGGVSVGPHDHVKQAAAECGFQEHFWRVRQKPGKPLFFATRNKVLLFGLPGNPVSAYMCFLFYVHPVLQYLQGFSFQHQAMPGRLAESVQNILSRTQLFRIRLQPGEDGPPAVYPLSRQGSHMLTSLTAADGFIILAPETELPAGAAVDVYPFR